MNDWVVETPSFEEDLMNNRVVMLNQNGVNRVVEIIKEKDKEIERLKKDNEYLNKKHEKIIHNIMEFVDKNTFNHRNTGERILTLHGKGILDLLDICLGSDKEWRNK